MAQSIFTPLYFANFFVDQVQDAKNKAIETFVYDDKARKSLKEFVEAQRTFTKEANRSFVELTDYLSVQTKEVVEKAVKSVKI